ncbi:MAG: hypothetical protein ACPG4U_14430 [Pseudomonadales bacterium]
MNHWQALAQELSAWPTAPRFWWRDDDAVADSTALRRMLNIAKTHRVPVHLAVIPAALEQSLDIVKDSEFSPYCYITQHGVEHQSFAREGERKIELGGTQDIAALSAALALGRQRLSTQFGAQYLDILVPPWNRIAPAVIAKLPEIGYRTLSVLGERSTSAVFDEVNVHIDIINWKARSFAGEADILQKLTALLLAKRSDGRDLDEPIGLMTHHLDHDTACWAFIEQFIAFCTKQDVNWVSGEQLYA